MSPSSSIAAAGDRSRWFPGDKGVVVVSLF